MSIGLHTNASAQEVARMAGGVLDGTNHTHQKLSSGNRMVRGYDDAGAYSVSSKMGAEIKHKLANYHNLQNAFSFLQSQDGALGQMQEIIKRMMVLKVRHSDIIKNNPDKQALDHEFEALQYQLASMRSEKFNGISLFDMKPVANAAGFVTVDPNKAFEVDTNDQGIGVIRIARHGVFENLKGKYGPDGVLNTQSSLVDTAYDGGDGGTGSHSILPTVKFSGGGGGVGAAAVVTVNDVEGHPYQGKITSITLTNPGNGYKTDPTIQVKGMGGGSPATITAVVDKNPGSPTYRQILRLEGTNSGEILSYSSAVGSPTPAFNSHNFIRGDGGAGYTGATGYAYVSPDTSGVDDVTLTSAGQGYAGVANDPSFSVSFPDGGGYGATATANVVNGEVVGLTVVNGGQDYNPAHFPNLSGEAMVSFTGGGGRGAKYTANISGGKIIDFNKIDGGADYSDTNPPTVRIASAGGYGGTGEPTLTTLHTSPTGTQIIDPITVTPHAGGFGTDVSIIGSATANAVVDYDPTSSSFGEVTGLTLTNGGSGYVATAPPTITITGPGGNTSAKYEAAVSGLKGISGLVGGGGYTSAPTLLVAGSPVDAAVLTPTMIDDGSGAGTFAIGGINITSTGSGYSPNPAISAIGGGGGGFSANGIVGTGEVTELKPLLTGSDYALELKVDPDDPLHPKSKFAKLTPTVDNDQASPDFGKITGLALIDGGLGYVDDSSLRDIEASFSAYPGLGSVKVGEAANDPGAISFDWVDNDGDGVDETRVVFQTDANGYNTYGTGYSTTPTPNITPPTFSTVAAAIQATATATTAPGEVQEIATTNAGTGFAETPTASTLSVTGPNVSIAASIEIGSIDANTGAITAISILNAGGGYESGDAVTFSGNGHGNPQAVVDTIGAGGTIQTFNIIDGGSGFQPLTVSIDAPTGGGSVLDGIGFANIQANGEIQSIDVRRHGFGYQHDDWFPDGDVATGGDIDTTVKIGDDVQNWEAFGGNPIAIPDNVSIFTPSRHEPNKGLTFTRRDENGIVHTTGSWRHDPGPDGLYQYPAESPHGLNSAGQGNDIYDDATSEQYTADYDNNNDVLNPLLKLADFSIRDFEDFMETLSNARASNAASSQRIQFSVEKVLQNYSDLEAAHERITQTDVAREMGHFSRFMILGKATLSFSKIASEMQFVALKLLKDGL